MATHKYIDAVCMAITVFTLLLTVLFLNGKALGLTAVVREEDSDAMFTANDLDAAWDASGATRITLSDGESRVEGNGAYVYGDEIRIVYAGKYRLSGALSDGSITIEADGDDKVWLLFEGVSVHCEDGAALHIEQAGKVFLTLAGNSENRLSSGETYSDEAVADGVDGTIYARDDLTVNGGGSLTVTAEYSHGVVCNDDFVVAGGTLAVTAAQDAIHANDSVRIKDAALTLEAGDDGITVSNDDETSFLYIESGEIDIPSSTEGLEAVRITVAGGRLDIAATDDGLNANGYSRNSLIEITGGEITVTIENGRDADGLDSNHDISISGGKLLVSVSDSGGSCAIDYGSEYGGSCEISGGTVLACGSSGMAEGFDAASPQGFVMQTTSAQAGTTVTLQDADGRELLSETVPCSFSSVLVSTPELAVGDVCTLSVGETETELTVDNSSAAGGFGGFGGFGGQMQGGNGFQRPGRGEFAGNGGLATLPSETSSTDAGTQYPQLPQNGKAGDLPTLPQEGTGGELPALPQDGSGEEATQSDPAFGGGMLTGRPDRGQRDPQATAQTGQTASQSTGGATPLSGEELLPLGISIVVLLAGCLVAALYKRRG